MPYGLQAMLKEGYTHVSGMTDAVYKNLEACKELSKIAGTSMGPNGMNKIVINHIEKTFVTSDATVMVNELEVQHPAAKLVVFAAKSQENEIGDGTNMVLSLAGALLDKAQGLLKEGLTTTEVAEGYTKATAKALEILEELMIPGSENIDVRDPKAVANRLKCPLAAKQYGYEDVLAQLIAKACISVCPGNPVNFNVDNVRTVKIPGAVVTDSTVVPGMVLKRAAEGSITAVKDCKVGVYAQGFDTSGTETKGTVLIHNAAELEGYAKSEEARMEEIVKGVADAGVRVIFSGAAIGEMAMHFLDKYGIMAVRVPSKFDLRRVCRTTGAMALVKVLPPTAQEAGHAAEVTLQELGGTRCVVIRQGADANGVATVVLRGSTEGLLADVERAVDDGVNCYKALTKDSRAVAAGGGVEIALARRLRDHGGRQPGLQQYSICAYADALETIPRILADNSGLDAEVCLRRLNAAHAAGQDFAGLDVETGEAKELQEEGLTDLLLAKWWAIKLTGDAVSTVLRVDQIIMAKQAGGPKPPQAGGNWDEE
eukprot:jgi/Ulvmu1/136/UM001_0140.1